MALEQREKRTSIPNFQLTKTVEVKVIRRFGDYVKGRWVEGDGEPITVKANVQPLKFHEILQLPESERTREWIKLYTTYDIISEEEGSETGKSPDIVVWNGFRYRVMRIRSYKMGVLNHNHVLCAREPISAL